MSVSEKLIIQLKNFNSRYSLRLNKNHYYVRNMFNAALREYKNTTYFNYVNRLYRYNRQRTVFLRRNHPYIKNMYNAFLATKQKVAAEAATAEAAAKKKAAAEAAEAAEAAAKKKAAAEAAAKKKAAAAAAEAAAQQKKTALLVGINYIGTASELRGCENDILNTKKILISKYGFKENEIVMLAESFGEKPTRANILKHMQNLVNKSNNGYSSLWFQYAGHGNYTTDYSGDEVDKKDECIATSDNKYISDDEFRKLFTSQINKNAKMFCLMDCCHSGTIMDLKYKYQSNKTNWTTENKYAVDANVIAISGCRDNQTSADAWLNSNWCGAMTTSFLNAMAATNYKPNMFTLLDKMRVFLRSNGFTQIPQLTSTQIINSNANFSI